MVNLQAQSYLIEKQGKADCEQRTINRARTSYTQEKESGGNQLKRIIKHK